MKLFMILGITAMVCCVLILACCICALIFSVKPFSKALSIALLVLIALLSIVLAIPVDAASLSNDELAVFIEMASTLAEYSRTFCIVLLPIVLCTWAIKCRQH